MLQIRDKKPQLTAKQLRGIQAILQADSMEQAAEIAEVNRKTLYRWLENDLFMRELSRAKRIIINQGLLKLQRGTNEASATLIEICQDKDAPPSSRVAAARQILDNTMKSIELEEFEERLKALEERLLIG
jgi:hypothetical protein